MNNYKIAITTGDKRGIGKEITEKALNILKLDKKDVLIIGEKINADYDVLEINEKENVDFCIKKNGGISPSEIRSNNSCY